MSKQSKVSSFAYPLLDEEIERFLHEDCPYGDLTTALLCIGNQPGRMTFTTRHETVACCTEEAARLLEKVGCTVGAMETSGTLLAKGETLLEVAGSAGALHMGWKAALNLLEAASGIATRTHRLVREARIANPSVEVVATRKIFPGTKAVATKATHAGGAFPHRLGLSESVLIFAQHTAFLGGAEELWARLPQIKSRAREKKIVIEVADQPREKKIVIEVADQPSAIAAALAGADVVQVDKLAPYGLSRLVETLRDAAPTILIAAAGGINEDNIRAYAAAGVDLLVSSAMYWGQPADIAARMAASTPS